MKNFGKYFILIIAFLSIGGGSSYGNTLPELKEDLSLSSEDLKAASPFSFAYRENPFQQIHDLSENHYFKNSSVVPEKFQFARSLTIAAVFPDFKRDIRRDIFQQIFPKHFFL